MWKEGILSITGHYRARDYYIEQLCMMQHTCSNKLARRKACMPDASMLLSYDESTTWLPFNALTHSTSGDWPPVNRGTNSSGHQCTALSLCARGQASLAWMLPVGDLLCGALMPNTHCRRRRDATAVWLREFWSMLVTFSTMNEWMSSLVTNLNSSTDEK